MKIGLYSWYRIFNKNRMLENFKTSDFGADNSNYNAALFVKRLLEQGHQVSTIDTEELKVYDKIIFSEYPEILFTGFPNKYLFRLLKAGFKELYLINMEPATIKPNNWVRLKHKPFKKIFTWHDDYVDNKKYIRLHSCSHKRSDQVCFNVNDQRKFCVFIARQKFSNGPRELYSERVKAIRWFEKNHLDDFDLYGGGWDEFVFKGRLHYLNLIDYAFKRTARCFPENHIMNRMLNKSVKFNYLFYVILFGRKPQYPSYRGVAGNVRETLKKYKFAFCFENSSFPGWITERIFDCFLAGCIPIYLGDPGISTRIPEEAFIDMRKFSSYEALYDYLKRMTMDEYLKRIAAIKEFMVSDKSYIFTGEYFADTLLREIF